MIPRDTIWAQRLKRLPEGLSARQAAKRLRQEYNLTRYWMLRLGYHRSDGRRSHWRASRLRAARRFNPARADWSQSNQVLADQHGVSRQRVFQMRKLHDPNYRKKVFRLKEAHGRRDREVLA